MEMSSSKLRLASSVSSAESLFKRSRLGKRQIVFVVLLVTVVAAGGFLLGYFVKGNSANTVNNCDPQGNQVNGTQPDKAEVSEVFRKFAEEVSKEELRKNLR